MDKIIIKRQSPLVCEVPDVNSVTLSNIKAKQKTKSWKIPHKSVLMRPLLSPSAPLLSLLFSPHRGYADYITAWQQKPNDNVNAGL